MKRYTIGLYEKAMPSTLTWKEKLKAAKEAGYDFVEISIDETDEKLARLNWTKEERLELIQYVKYPISYNKEAVKSLVRRAMAKGYYEGVNLSLAYCDDCGHEELIENIYEQRVQNAVFSCAVPIIL